MGQVGRTIATAGEAMAWYLGKAVNEIDPSIFAVKPRGEKGEIDTNHPAFIVGHLAIYPGWLLGMIGVDAGVAAMPESYQSLFSAKSNCMSDPEGRIYPKKDELVTNFDRGHAHLFQAMRKVDDDAFQKPTPSEGMRDKFPTVGELIDFMVGVHAGSHVGQLSAWRRCMGLGKVF